MERGEGGGSGVRRGRAECEKMAMKGRSREERVGEILKKRKGARGWTGIMLVGEGRKKEGRVMSDKSKREEKIRENGPERNAVVNKDPYGHHLNTRTEHPSKGKPQGEA